MLAFIALLLMLFIFFGYALLVLGGFASYGGVELGIVGIGSYTFSRRKHGGRDPAIA